MSTITISAADFRRALNQVLRAASTDRDGGVLRGVLVEATDTSLRFVATDKHRLAVSDVPITHRAGRPPVSVVLDAETLTELSDTPADGEVVLSLTAKRASASVDGRSVEVPVLGGDFPDHRSLLRQIAGDTSVVPLITDRDAVIDALEELPDDEPLRAQFKHGAIEFGQLVPIVVTAAYDGPATALSVEPTYLHDAITAAPGPELAIEAVDATSPIVVRTPGDDSYLAVVMPVLVGSRTPRKR